MIKKSTRRRTTLRALYRTVLSVAVATFVCISPIESKTVKMPAHFQSYSMTDIGNKLRCIVGNTTQEGLNGRAFVYLIDLTTHEIRWVTKIPLRPNDYQNRATHCLAGDKKVYALIQTDTSSFQATSQTFVDVVTLDEATGQIESTENVIAKEAGRRPSTWVDGGPENFRRENGKIVVTGQYFNLDNPEVRKPFTASPAPATP
ncbi:hypothetical protein [Luteibacter anthropi]|uniref:Uncharacterized protein n=1 Tax=Luteibacter anthropi TaxID=564369 RepID=A0A7X5U914_9GAMM|nr:hypothetical protein [Luteibacter anthropi]NII06027.1 hypothetical protein [Luteibacter anthropi]